MLPVGIGLCAFLLLAGCGSKSKTSFPSLGSQGTPEAAKPGVTAGWQTISGNRFDVGSTKAMVSVVAINPLRLRLQVNASPDVVTQTNYQVHCDQRSTFGRNMSGTTPLTREIAIPRGGKSGSAKDVECFVTANATKPAHVSMTLVLLQRLAGKAHR
jgi:hypothetical protein